MPSSHPRWPIAVAAGAFAALGLLVTIVVTVQHLAPFGFEVAWMSAMVDARTPVLTAIGLVFNAIGGGVIATWIVPVVVAVLLLLWRRPWAALFFVLASAVSAGLVHLLKQLIGRPRPTEMLVPADFGALPSGHSANAALVAAALGIIVCRTWVWAVGGAYTVLMMLSRTYLGAHWVTDTIGGALVGVGVAIVLWVAFARFIERERAAARPPIWVARVAA